MVEDYQDNYGNGWISVYRSIKSHWVWSDPKKLKWWLTILFEVNHSENKISIGYNVHQIKKGQSAKSLRTWASEFDTGVKSVVKFFQMLEKDGMIKRETIGKGKQSTTLLTVCNYNTYQNSKPKKETQGGTQGERKGVHEGGTNNKDNNYNNVDKHKLVLWLEDNAPRVQKMSKPITNEEADRLKKDFSSDVIIEIFTNMHNYKPLTKSVSANLTFRKWAKNRETEVKEVFIPKPPVL